MKRQTLFAAAIALAAGPTLMVYAQQDRPQAGQTLQQPDEPERSVPPQDQDQQDPSLRGEQPMDDRLFAMAAASSGMGEVGISRLAMQKTDDEQVRQFAERMIEDHTQANQMLIQIAEGKGIQFPQQPDLKDTASTMALAGCSPDKFAEEYFKQQEAAHILAVGLFKAEAERGQDEELRSFARQTLPKLEEHLQMARQHAGGQDAAPGTRPGLDTPGLDR